MTDFLVQHAVDRALKMALEAAATVLPMRQTLQTANYKGSDKAQMITAADMAVCAVAQRHFGDDLVSEETYKGAFAEACAKLARPTTTFVVDEVDGTTDLASGLHSWGHLVGVVHSGQVVGSVMVLPAYFTGWDQLHDPFNPALQQGLVFVGYGGTLLVGRLVGGVLQGELAFWQRPRRPTYYATLAATFTDRYVFDYGKGLLPRTECSCIADFVQLLLGRSVVATFGSKLWDVAGATAILRAAGCAWYKVGDLSAPGPFLELFDDSFNVRDSWLIGPDIEAVRVANSALRPA